ncbi:MAG: protein kinase domain-containing protein [Gemmatimonadales bacterium]
MTVVERACPSCATPLPEKAQFCMNCGTATPTDPGVPPRTQSTGAFEVAQVTRALAGRYKIERVLGEGGMATVYLADDPKHDRKVAVKVMRPELAATLGADRFLREVQIAAKLNHPNILAMHDSGATDGLLYYVMPYVEGETLKEKLERDGALAPDEALRLAREVVEALAYAHKRGIVHRDIKPANILLNEGHALVADFGIARAVEDGTGESLTKTGLAVGTPQYMAPEQATGERAIDGRADLYAAGAILYEMLAGQPPFTGQNARVILTKSLTERPTPLVQVRATLPPIFDTVVQKALAKSADERFASATEFVAAIDAMRTPSSVSHPAIPAVQATQMVAAAAPTRGRPAWLSPRNVLVAGLAAVALFFALRGRAPGAAAPDPSAKRGNRLAVLPFRAEQAAVDMSLLNGIVDDIRGRLFGLSALTVIGSGTVDEYRNSAKSPVEIGRELSVDYLLTGEMHWTGDGASRRLVVSPKLLDARTGAVLWQKDATVEDGALPGVSAELAAGVGGALGITPSAEEQRLLAAWPTKNEEAYRAGLRGRQVMSVSGTDPATLRAGVSELEQAVALDSTYARAWAALVIASSNLYTNGNRDPRVAARAKAALDHAVALQSTARATRWARSVYLLNVAGDEQGASAEIDLALRESPNDAGLLSSSGSQDMNRGDLGSALAKFERVRDLEPRMSSNLNNLMSAYTYLGRAAEAKAAGTTLLPFRPMDTQTIQQVAIAYLADGDVEGARGVLRAAVQRGVPAPRLATQMTGFNETGWALDEASQQLVLRLNSASFDDDRAWWAQSLATLHWQRGDTVLARAYADSAVAPTRQQVAGAPNDPQLHGLFALMLAYLGRAAEARAEEQRSLARVDRYSLQAYNLVNAAKTELALGDRDAALALLAKARQHGYYVTDGWLRVDPTFASLKGYPPFEQMAKGKQP